MNQLENTQSTININDILEKFITGFHGVHDKNAQLITIRMALDQIKNPCGSRLVKITEEATELFRDYYSAIGDADEPAIQAAKAIYYEFKKQFDLIYFAGQFEGRNDLEVATHSGVIPIDIDGMDQLDKQGFAHGLPALKQDLINDPSVIAVYTSPSGFGLKVLVLVPIPPAETPKGIQVQHKAAFQAIRHRWEKQYNIVIDESGSNVGRGSYLCHDAELLINEIGAIPFPFVYNEDASISSALTSPGKSDEYKILSEHSDTDNKPGTSNSLADPHTLDLVQRICDECHKRNISITESYSDWVTVGFALKRGFGDDLGLELFDRFSRLDSSYDKEVVQNKWQGLEPAYSGKRITIASLIWLSKLKGIEVFSSLSKADRFEHWFRSHYETKLNLLDHTVYWSSLDATGPFTRFSWDYDISSVARDAEKALKICIDDKIVTRIVKDAASKAAFNPLVDYLESLRWDGQDRLNDLYASIVTDNDPLFRNYFTKWFVNLIPTALGLDSNDKVIVLQGDQGTGKTYFLENLLPRYKDLKLTETTLKFNPEDKDALHLAITRMLLIFDEMTSYSKNNLQALKSFISCRELTIRSPYGRDYNTFKKVASCCGCVNEERFLRDATGDRRYLVFQCVQRDIHLFDSINKEQLLAQAVSMYKEGYDYRFSMEEYQKVIDRNREDFAANSTDEMMLQQYLYASEVERMTIPEILAGFQARHEYRLTAQPSTLGQYLKNLGIETKRARIDGKKLNVYYCTFDPKTEDNISDKVKKQVSGTLY